jgi:exodeoxyribonuclease V alpha subunit
MVDINLLYDFLTLIQNYDVISVFLGDYNKLLSTGPGNIFKDMISSKKIPTTTLNNTYKYDTKLVLKDIINKINNGYEINKLDYNNLIEFELIITYNYNNIDNIIEDECKKYEIIIAITNNIIKKYTNIIRDIKNPKNKQIEYNNNIYRLNDVVIHTKNFNSEKLYNGMTGKIIKIYKKNNIFNVVIKCDDNRETYIYKSNEDFINYLQPVYAITCHKSQSFEYDNILFILTPSQLLNKNLLYTAITRAKQKVTIISSSIELINNTINKIVEKNTLMKSMIKYCVAQI